MRLRLALLAALLLGAAGGAPAQEAPPASAGDFATTVEVPPQILTLDQDKLFGASAFGKRVAAEIERRSAALAAENRSIETQLIAEEQALTDARQTLAPEEFRARADAFDTKVQRIRGEQDGKARALGTFRDSEQQRFTAALGPILAEIARERGALAVADRRVLLISADAIDITEDAVALVDERLGDGADSAPPVPDPADPADPAPVPGDAAPGGATPGAPAPADTAPGGN